MIHNSATNMHSVIGFIIKKNNIMYMYVSYNIISQNQ